MANTPLPAAKPQFFDSNGNPLNGGKLFTYQPSTTTPKTTYQDFGGTTPNSNPIILNSRGETPFAVYGDGTFRLILKDSLDNTIWDTETKSYATSLTSGDIIAALGYTPVNPAANNAYSGNNTYSGTNTYTNTVTFSGNTVWTVSPSFNVPINVTTDTLAAVNVNCGDDGSTVAIAELYRDSASPAANDFLFTLRFAGRSAAGTKRTYADIEAEIVDATNTSEDGRLNFKTVIAGSLGTRFQLGHGLHGTGLADPGANLINAAGYQVAGTLIPYQRRFTSTYQALPSATGGLLTVAHGLGVAPRPEDVKAKVKNVSGGTVAGWANNEEFAIPLQQFDGGSTNVSGGCIIYTDATNIYLQRCWNGTTGGVLFLLSNKSGGTTSAPTDANWNIQLSVDVQ